MTTHRATAGFLLAGALMGCSGGEAPLNVVILTVDSLRHDFVGVYGGMRGPTPELDRLAASGVVFTDAASTTTWTLPSHLSLLTGQYQASHGVFGDASSLDPGKETIGEYLRERGYRTGGFVSGPYLNRAYGFDQGFDLYRHCVSYGEEFDEDGNVENVIRVNQRSHHGVTAPRLYARVDEWIDTLDDDRPFFLFVHHWDPHYDFTPQAPYDRFLDPSYAGSLRGEGFLQNRRIRAEMSATDRRRLLDLYRGEVRYTDAWIGHLLDRLEERGALDRTLLVVTADHGEEFFEHGNKGHRINLYEETLRIPLIVRGSGFEPGQIVREPVSLIDVFATVRAALGDSIPERIQGVDLARVGEARERPGVVAELHDDLVAFRSRDWKLVRHLKTGTEELFHLGHDPGEVRDRVHDEPEVRARLSAELVAADPGRFAFGQTPPAVIDEATQDALRALGYTD